MLDKFLALLERFVVAHELIAANSAKTTLIEKVGDVVRAEEKVSGGVGPEGSFTVDNKTGKRIKIEVEDDLVIDTKLDAEMREFAEGVREQNEEIDKADDEPEEKPKRKPRQTKPKAEPEPDLDKLREEISVMAKHIGSGDSDDCADELDDLMDEYDVRSVKKLKDLQVQEFHKELKAIVAKYYDIED